MWLKILVVTLWICTVPVPSYAASDALTGFLRGFSSSMEARRQNDQMNECIRLYGYAACNQAIIMQQQQEIMRQQEYIIQEQQRGKTCSITPGSNVIYCY